MYICFFINSSCSILLLMLVSTNIIQTRDFSNLIPNRPSIHPYTHTPTPSHTQTSTHTHPHTHTHTHTHSLTHTPSHTSTHPHPHSHTHTLTHSHTHTHTYTHTPINQPSSHLANEPINLSINISPPLSIQSFSLFSACLFVDFSSSYYIMNRKQTNKQTSNILNNLIPRSQVILHSVKALRVCLCVCLRVCLCLCVSGM